MLETLPILIVGGGIAGLSAAWEIQRQSPETPYILLESSERWGGKIQSKRLDNPQAIIDAGPESFLTRKPEVWDLIHELGIEAEIIVPASETAGMNVLHGGKIYPIPLHPVKFLQSNLLSWQAKLRLLAEPFIPARRDMGDESLADFARRRLGHEVLERLIGPVLGGIYNADPQTQSILYTSPVMREMEAEHGGLFLGSIARMKKGKTKDAAKPRFIALKNGAETLVEALIAQLTGEKRLNTAVTWIEALGEHYRAYLSNGKSIEVSGVILATPANVAARILNDFAPDAAAKLASIRQSNLGTLSLLYRNTDLGQSAINGLMIPRSEKRAIDAIQFSSKRIAGRTDAAHSLLRVFFGGAKPELHEMDAAERHKIIQAELAELLGINAEPIFSAEFCWKAAYPQADVGHLDKVAQIEALLPKNIALAGASYRGLGVPDCIRQGRDAGQQLLETIQQTNKTTIVESV